VWKRRLPLGVSPSGNRLGKDTVLSYSSALGSIENCTLEEELMLFIILDGIFFVLWH
jgi:hypothetical protein